MRSPVEILRNQLLPSNIGPAWPGAISLTTAEFIKSTAIPWPLWLDVIIFSTYGAEETNFGRATINFGQIS